MALSMELLKRLNSNDEPLFKRLKLAENAFYTVDVSIVHKEDLILQWFCKTCQTEQEAWASLKTCLKAKYLNLKTDVKQVLTKILIETFQKDIKHIHNDVFECCSLIVSNSGIQQYYISKPEDLGLLIKSLLECVYKIFKHTFNNGKQMTQDINTISKSDGLILKAYNTTINVIENLIQIFKYAFITKDSFRTMFIRDVLYSLCVIIDYNHIDNRNKLSIVIHKCIQQIIFEKKYIQNGEFSKSKDNIEQLKNLVSILTENAKTKNLKSILMTFTLFFRVAISTFKSDTIVLDIMLRELINYSEIYRKQILSSLLKYLNDLTFNFDNKVHDITLFDYCQNIIDNILISKSMSDVDYDLLTQFCNFNPLIIERKIQDILRKVFIEKLTSKYTNLMISILDVSIHLRQEEKLISAILTALKDCVRQISTADTNMFFPNKFKEKLMKAINNITNSQSVVMLRTITYNLKSNCLEALQFNNTCKDDNTLMLQAIVELLITFLEGICIFEYNRTSVFYEKFINAFNDLRNVLLLLIEKVLYLKDDEKIIILLTAIFSWNETQRALKYYVHYTIPENIEISENQWKQLIKRNKKYDYENYTNNMNKLILQQVKMSSNKLNKSSKIFNILINNLEHCWYLILKFDTDIISSLSNEQVSKLTHLLLVHMTSNTDNFNTWIMILHKNELLENKRLIISILYCVLTQIEHSAIDSVTNSINKYLNTELLLEVEIVESKQIDKILLSIKEELIINKWIQIQDVYLCKIKVYLEVLLHLPLMFLSVNIRLITFMFLFALRMECTRSNEIVSICNTIFTDLLENSNINVFQYIDPILLLQQLPRNRVIQKALELFIRNCSYASLKKLVTYSASSNQNMFFLLESMEHVKSKLSADQKTIIRKGKKRLINIFMETLSSKVIETDDLKILNLILRISVISENIDDKLKNVIELILQNIFVSNKVANKHTNELLQNGLQFISVILRNKRLFQITNQILRGIWYALFKYPCTDVLLSLLETSESEEFSEFIEELHNQLVKALLNAQDNDIENICFIWNAILKTNMSNDRNKLRLTAISNFIQTIQTVSIPEKFWPNLLKLIQNIFVTKHLYLPSYIIDMSIIIGLKSLQENSILVCSDTLTLCSVLLKMRTDLITDRIPSLLVLYRQILSIVVHKSKVISNKSDEHLFKCIALDIEKFTSSLIKLKKDMVRISPYVVADLLELFLESSIANFIKITLQNCINHLISICDQHGIALLSRTLPVPMQEIFKAQLETYNKFYKFSGKI